MEQPQYNFSTYSKIIVRKFGLEINIAFMRLHDFRMAAATSGIAGCVQTMDKLV